MDVFLDVIQPSRSSVLSSFLQEGLFDCFHLNSLFLLRLPIPPCSSVLTAWAPHLSTYIGPGPELFRCVSLASQISVGLPEDVVIVQLPSHVWFSETPWTAACQASLSLTISQSLPKFTSIASVMPSSRLILWCLLPLPSIFPSIRDFSNESAVHIRWPKYWSFSISLSNEYSGLISLELACLISLQFKGLSRGFSSSSKASVLWWSAFFMVQLSHLYHWKHHNFDYMDFGL